MLRSVTLALALLVITVQPLLAACAEQAIPELRRGAPLTILRTDGSVTTASFIRAEGNPPRFVLEERLRNSQQAPRRYDLAASDVARLEAPPRPTFHVERVGICALVGSMIGTIAGIVIPVARRGRPVFDVGFTDQAWPDNRAEAILVGAMSGAILGTAVGLFVSTGGGKPPGLVVR